MQFPIRPVRRFGIAVALITATASVASSQHHPAGAQDTEDVPAVLIALADLLPQSLDDPIVVEFLTNPGETGSVAADPAGDVFDFAERNEGASGPDLLGFSWFTLPAGSLAEGFGSLITTEPRPEGIALYGQDPWVEPDPDATLVAFVAQLDRIVSVSLPDACIVALNVRRPGPTTPEDRISTRDPNADTNRSYQLAGWDTLPNYATEADTSTEDFSTVNRESSFFGALADDQAVLLIPLSELEDVSAFRMSIRCAASDDVGATLDISDLVPFDPTSLADAFFGATSSRPAPTTSTTTPTTTTTTTTTVTPPAPTAPDASAGSDDGSTGPDPASSGGLIGTWTLIAGLVITVAGGWVLYRSPLWTDNEGLA